MSDAWHKSLAVPLCFVKLKKQPPSILRGILKREWVVLPPGNIDAATPEVAVATSLP